MWHFRVGRVKTYSDPIHIFGVQDSQPHDLRLRAYCHNVGCRTAVESQSNRSCKRRLNRNVFWLRWRFAINRQTAPQKKSRTNTFVAGRRTRCYANEQVIDWKDSPTKWPIMLIGTLDPSHSLARSRSINSACCCWWWCSFSPFDAGIRPTVCPSMAQFIQQQHLQYEPDHRERKFHAGLPVANIDSRNERPEHVRKRVRRSIVGTRTVRAIHSQWLPRRLKDDWVLAPWRTAYELVTRPDDTRQAWPCCRRMSSRSLLSWDCTAGKLAKKQTVQRVAIDQLNTRVLHN